MSETLQTLRGFRAAAAALLVTFLLTLGATAKADAKETMQDSRPPVQGQVPRPRSEMSGPALVRALNLSPEQRAEIARIRREVEPEARAANQRVRRSRRALEDAVYASAADEALIERRAAELAEAETARARLRALTELRIRRLLTPEQLDDFRELRRRASRRQLRTNRRLAPAAPPRQPSIPRP